VEEGLGSEYESIRELAVFSKKEAMHLSDVATNVRLNNYIQKSGANLEEEKATS